MTDTDFRPSRDQLLHMSVVMFFNQKARAPWWMDISELDTGIRYGELIAAGLAERIEAPKNWAGSQFGALITDKGRALLAAEGVR